MTAKDISTQPTSKTAVVDVKSSWFSKINWTQVAPFVVSVLALVGINIDQDIVVKVVAGVSAVSAVITVIMRTFFTKAVTAASVETTKK